MSRTPVFKISCSRCGRDEFYEDKELGPEDQLDLALTFRGEVVQFPELCSSCRVTVGNYVKSIKKQAKKKGPKPPLSPPPTPTPPASSE